MDKNRRKATLQIILNGTSILFRREMEVLWDAEPQTLQWNIPIGIEGYPLFITCTIKIERLSN